MLAVEWIDHLQGLGDSLLGDWWTCKPVLAQALRVDDVLPRLHCHVLAHLTGVAGGQLENLKFNFGKKITISVRYATARQIVELRFWNSQEGRSSWPASRWSHPPPWTCTPCPGSCARPDKRSGSGRWGEKMSFSNQRTKCLTVSWPFITDGIRTKVDGQIKKEIAEWWRLEVQSIWFYLGAAQIFSKCIAAFLCMGNIFLVLADEETQVFAF